MKSQKWKLATIFMLVCMIITSTLLLCTIMERRDHHTPSDRRVASDDYGFRDETNHGFSDLYEGGSIEVGNGYSAVSEITAPLAASRVLFFSHRFLNVSGIVDTIGDPYVVPSWSPTSFLIACDARSEDSAAPKARIIEYDAKSNKVLHDYTHPRGLARLNIPGQPQMQRSAIVRSPNKSIWLITQDVHGDRVTQHIEALDWPSKVLTYHMDIPPDLTGRVLFAALQEGCILFSRRPSRTDVRAVFRDGPSVDFPLKLRDGEYLEFQDAFDNLICAITSESRLVVMEYFPTTRQGVVRFVGEVFSKNDGRAVRAMLLPDEPTVMMIALGPYGDTAADEVIFVSIMDGSVTSKGMLERPAAGISYSDGFIFALSRDSWSFVVYDRQLRPVQRQRSHMITVINVAP